MIDGFNNDDCYRMVEDEFLDVAKEFTQHLHAAEYQRMKKAARAQNAATISSISRPVSTKMPDQTKRKVESIARAKKQAESITKLRGNQPRELGDDSDEAPGPWIGTALHGLMEKPRASATSLTDISEIHSSSKAAAGHKGSVAGRMDNYDLADFEEPGLTNPFPPKGDPYDAETEEEDEDEDEDDDLGGASTVMQVTAPAQKPLTLPVERIYSPPKPSSPTYPMKREELEPLPFKQEEPSATTSRLSSESVARIAKRREQARMKRIKDEEDTQIKKEETKPIPTFL